MKRILLLLLLLSVAACPVETAKTVACVAAIDPVEIPEHEPDAGPEAPADAGIVAQNVSYLTTTECFALLGNVNACEQCLAPLFAQCLDAYNTCVDRFCRGDEVFCSYCDYYCQPFAPGQCQTEEDFRNEPEENDPWEPGEEQPPHAERRHEDFAPETARTECLDAWTICTTWEGYEYCQTCYACCEDQSTEEGSEYDPDSLACFPGPFSCEDEDCLCVSCVDGEMPYTMIVWCRAMSGSGSPMQWPSGSGSMTGSSHDMKPDCDTCHTGGFAPSERNRLHSVQGIILNKAVQGGFR